MSVNTQKSLENVETIEENRNKNLRKIYITAIICFISFVIVSIWFSREMKQIERKHIESSKILKSGDIVNITTAAEKAGVQFIVDSVYGDTVIKVAIKKSNLFK
jgi:methionine aminopeptidase